MSSILNRLMRRVFGSDLDLESLGDEEICNRYAKPVLQSLGPIACLNKSILTGGVISQLSTTSTASQADNLTSGVLRESTDEHAQTPNVL
jgi:hypothetical protein